MKIVFLFSTLTLAGCGLLFPYESVSSLDTVKIHYGSTSSFSETLVNEGYSLEQKRGFARDVAFIQRVKSYVEAHPNLSPEVRRSLEDFTIMKGMDQDQIIVLLGPPREKKAIGEGRETWVYSHWLNGKYVPDDFSVWFADWARLTFKKGILFKIQKAETVAM